MKNPKSDDTRGSITSHGAMDNQTDERVQALKTELTQAQQFIDEAPCGFLSVDAGFQILSINNTLLEWLGYSREEVVGKLTVHDLIDPVRRGTADLRMQALRESSRTEPMEIDIRRKSGAFFHALVSSSAVRNDQGEFVCTNTTVVDISDRKNAEQRTAAHARFLQAITDRIPVRLAYYDKDLICRFANLGFASRHGKHPADMLGAHLSQYVRSDVLPEILPRVANVLSGTQQTFEAERVAADGARRYYEVHYIPDFQSGSVEGFFAEVHDITDRRESEDFILQANRDLEDRVQERSAELFRSEQRYRLMVDAIQDYCVYFIDEEGLVTEWSDSAQRMHGHARDQIVGKHFRHLMAAGITGEEEIDADEVLRLAKTHGQWESRGWRLRDDGSRFWAHSIVTALRSENDELQGLSIITRDMTAAKSLEDVMNDLNKELEKRVAERTQQLVAANKDLDVFSHMVSHDLRAPLRHISSFVSLLQEELGEHPDVAVQQYLGSIVKSSKRMGLMIEGLLEYARLGRVAIEAKPVALFPLVEGVVSHLKQENPTRQIDWVIAPDLPVVRGDAMLLAEVFGNLLNNSVKFTRNRPQAAIKVGWQADPVGGRTFYINDNGVGFDLEKAHNLFVMFQRQHHSMDYEGNGTGLALSQRIIERHGGRIWAETAPGQGCTFYFTLPFEGLEPDLELPGSTLEELSS